MMFRCFALSMLLGLGLSPASAAEPAIAESLKAITAVSREGAGNDAAAKAWKSLVSQGQPALIPTLTAFQDANPTAANWLRTAADAIAENERAAKKPLPKETLIAFIQDAKQHPDARRIAFEIVQVDHAAEAKTLLPKFLNDPSLELRRDAIEAAFQADAKTESAGLQKLFAAARDKDQVEQIAKELEKLKKPVNITKHYGYITQWSAIGPFLSKDGAGFAKAYPPETKVDLNAELDGSLGKVKWVPAQADNTYASMDLNTVLGKHKDSAAYTHAAIITEKELPGEIRAATKNAVKIFLNGKEVFAREEYHHGIRMDQHSAKVTFLKGRNDIVLKVCQNDQKESWAQDWTFSARVCDSSGAALPVKQAIVKDGTETIVELGTLKPAMKKEGK